MYCTLYTGLLVGGGFAIFFSTFFEWLICMIHHSEWISMPTHANRAQFFFFKNTQSYVRAHIPISWSITRESKSTMLLNVRGSTQCSAQFDCAYLKWHEWRILFLKSTTLHVLVFVCCRPPEVGFYYPMTFAVIPISFLAHIKWEQVHEDILSPLQNFN